MSKSNKNTESKIPFSQKNNIKTRVNVLEFLAEIINRNSVRAHLQVDPRACASSGTFMNLTAVVLKLCEPFLDKKEKIDGKYVFNSSRLNFKGLTPLNSSLSEAEDREKSGFNFISECFFMTARVINLGLIKVLSDHKNLVQDINSHEDYLHDLKSMQMQGQAQFVPHLDQNVARIEKELELLTQENLCYEAQILEDDIFLRSALSFYRLMVAWMVDQVGSFKFPFPKTCPKELASIPEHFVEDVMEFLLFVSNLFPNRLDSFLLEDFMNFIIVFMATPEYIRNPYIRAKMVEVLHFWMSQAKASGCSSVTATLFERHPYSNKFLVKNLLKVYVDMEFTEFNEKFKVRHQISELLEYLWGITCHCDAWSRIATEEEKGIYFNFLNFLINDSIYLLDESLTKIVELKELKSGEMTNRLEFENIIRSHMKSANENVSMLAYTSEKITAPFLREEMVERVASMLNYFLLLLVGPQKNRLKLNDPESYEFDPKHLLKQIVNIYINLARGDGANIFPAAIVTDGRSYNNQLFSQASSVLKRISEYTRELGELEQKVKVAATEALDAESSLGETPEEFLDPIQYTFMKDPVILPSSKVTKASSKFKLRPIQPFPSFY